MVNIIYVGEAINEKKDISNGSHIRRYYALASLKNKFNTVIINGLKDVFINHRAIFRKNSLIWVHYPSSRKTCLISILLSFLTSNEMLLYIHDFPVEQKKGFTFTTYSFNKMMSLKILQQILLCKSQYLVLASPLFLDLFPRKSYHSIFYMLPGFGLDEANLLFSKSTEHQESNRKKALYFGSMNRADSIFLLSKVFSKITDWDLHLLGPLEGMELQFDSKNVIYLGQKKHDDVLKGLKDYDVIIIPYPKNNYIDKIMPIKLGYSFASCKPVITSRTDGIELYVSLVGLEKNVIYIDEWTEENLLEALEAAEELKINQDDTFSKMETIQWEICFEKLFKYLETDDCSLPNKTWLKNENMYDFKEII